MKFVVRHKYLLQATFGFSLLAILVTRLNPYELMHHLKSAPVGYLIPWLAGYYLIEVFNWAAGVYFLLRRMKPGGFLKLLGASYKLQVLSVFIPGRLGDLGLLYFLKDSFKVGQISAVLLVDKLITLGVNLVLAALGFGLMFSWRYSIIVILMLPIGFSILMWLLFNVERMGNRSERYWLIGRFASRLSVVSSETVSTLIDFGGCAKNLFVTLIRYLSAGISMTLILHWFGVEVPLGKVILIQAVAQLATILPATIMGIGVQEVLQVTLFSKLGAPAEIVLAVMLSARAVHFTLIFLVYVFWMWRSPLVPIKAEINASSVHAADCENHRSLV